MKIFAQTGWRLAYYVCEDVLVLEDLQERIVKELFYISLFRRITNGIIRSISPGQSTSGRIIKARGNFLTMQHTASIV